MKRLILILAFLLPVLVKAQPNTAPAIGSTDYLDYKHAYKNIHLGADISTLNQELLTKISSDVQNDGTLYYSYNDEEAMDLGGGVHLKTISLNVYNNKILNVYLMFNEPDGNKVKEILTAAYGKETKRPDRFLNNYIWHGKQMALYLFYESGRTPTIVYRDKVLNAQVEQAKKDANTKAANNL